VVNKLKFDLGDTVRQVQELNRSLEALGTFSQTLFANLGRLSETFGTSVANASQNVQQATGVGPETALTDVGRREMAGQQGRDAAQALRDAGLVEQLSMAEDDKRRRLKVGPEGQLFEVRSSQFGTYHKSYGNKADLDNRIAARSAADRARESEAQVATPGLGASPVAPTYAPGRSIAGIGYGLADLPRVMKAQEGLGQNEKQLAKTIEQLSRSGDTNSRDMVMVLSQLREDLSRQNQSLVDSIRNFREVSGKDQADPARQQALQALTSQMGTFEAAREQAMAAERVARPGGGDGGGRRRALEGLAGGFTRGAAAIGAGVGAVGGMALTYQHAALATERAVYGRELQLAETRGQAAEMGFQQAISSVDMTKAENIMKFRGDMMFPGRYKYLGREGIGRSYEAAMSMTQQQIEIERRQRQLGVTQGLFGLVGGGVQMAGGAAIMGLGATGLGLPVAAALGGPMMIGGMQQVMGGARGALGAYLESPYTAYTGGLNQGLSGVLGRSMYGARFKNLSEFAQQAAMQTKATGVAEAAIRFQEAEMRETMPQQMAINEQLQMIQSQKDAVMQVGRYALTRSQLLESEYTPIGDPERFAGIVGPRQAGALRGPATQIATLMAERDQLSTPPSGAADRYQQNKIRISRIGEINTQIARLENQGFGMSRMGLPGSYDQQIYRARSVEAVRSVMGGRQNFGLSGQLGRNLGVSHAIFGGTTAHLGSKFTNFDKDFSRAMASAGPTARAKFANVPESQMFAAYAYEGPEQFERSILAGGFAPGTRGQMADVAEAMSEIYLPSTLDQFASTTAAGLEMTPAELMGRHATMIGAMGAGYRGRDRAIEIKQAAGLTRLGRVGFGDFQSLMGNLTDINRTAGGINNESKLRSVLTEALAAGFDRSRLAQSFVRQTLEISRSLDVTNISGVARQLNVGARVMSITGQPDERSFALAAQSMAQYGQYTAQTGGLIGAAKFQGIFGGGGNLMTAGLLQGRSAPELTAFLGELDGSITSQRLQELVSMAPGGTDKQKRDYVRETIKSTRRGARAPMLGITNMFLQAQGKNVGDMVKEIKAETNPEKKRVLIEQFRGSFGGVGGLAGQEFAYRGLGIELLADEGAIGAGVQKDMLQEETRLRYEKWVDPARQNTRRYIDQLVGDFSAATKGVSFQKFREYLSEGGMAIPLGLSDSKGNPRMLDPKTMDRLIKLEAKGGNLTESEQVEMNAAHEALNKVSQLDMARSMQYAQSVSTGEQSVRVSNFMDLAAHMIALNPWKNIGNNTETGAVPKGTL